MEPPPSDEFHELLRQLAEETTPQQRPPFRCSLFLDEQPFRVLRYERHAAGLHVFLPTRICSTWQLQSIMLAPMTNSPARYQFPTQLVPLVLVKSSVETSDSTYYYEPQMSIATIPLFAHGVMNGAKNKLVLLALLDENGFIIAEAAAPFLSESTKRDINSPVLVTPTTTPQPPPIETIAAPIPEPPAPTLSAKEIRDQNGALLLQAAAFIGIPQEAIRDVDSISLRLIVERCFTDLQRPCWAVRPSGSRLQTFVLTYVDLSGPQPGIAERQVELVLNEHGQFQYLRILVDDALVAPRAATLPALIQSFFPYLQVALPASAYRRDMPKSV